MFSDRLYKPKRTNSACEIDTAAFYQDNFITPRRNLHDRKQSEQFKNTDSTIVANQFLDTLLSPPTTARSKIIEPTPFKPKSIPNAPFNVLRNYSPIRESKRSLTPKMQEAPASSRPTSQKENSRANKLSNQHRSYVILQVLSDINLDSHKKIEQIQQSKKYQKRMEFVNELAQRNKLTMNKSKPELSVREIVDNVSLPLKVDEIERSPRFVWEKESQITNNPDNGTQRDKVEEGPSLPSENPTKVVKKVVKKAVKKVKQADETVAIKTEETKSKIPSEVSSEENKIAPAVKKVVKKVIKKSSEEKPSEVEPSESLNNSMKNELNSQPSSVSESKPKKVVKKLVKKVLHTTGDKPVEPSNVKQELPLADENPQKSPEGESRKVAPEQTAPSKSESKTQESTQPKAVSSKFQPKSTEEGKTQKEVSRPVVPVLKKQVSFGDDPANSQKSDLANKIDSLREEVHQISDRLKVLDDRTFQYDEKIEKLTDMIRILTKEKESLQYVMKNKTTEQNFRLQSLEGLIESLAMELRTERLRYQAMESGAKQVSDNIESRILSNRRSNSIHELHQQQQLANTSRGTKSKDSSVIDIKAESLGPSALPDSKKYRSVEKENSMRVQDYKNTVKGSSTQPQQQLKSILKKR